MQHAELRLEPNEASDLCPLFDTPALEREGWSEAFATVLDESPAETALALLVHQAGAEPSDGWRALRVKGKARAGAGRTTDAEACARRDGALIIVGSQFGAKEGPLEPSRSFLARVREDALLGAVDGDRVDIEVARLRFGLHRAVNDALARSAIELLELGPRTREAYIDATIARGARGDKRWAGRVKSADHPLNVEAADFRADGRLLLGLRYPVSRDGHPLLIELDDVDAIFAEPDAIPSCSSVWVLENVGDRDTPMGVRALHARGPDAFDAIVGDLDAAGKGETIVADHPQAGHSKSHHVSFALPMTAAGGSVTAETVLDFTGEHRVEGVATSATGRTYYVTDAKGGVTLSTVE